MIRPPAAPFVARWNGTTEANWSGWKQRRSASIPSPARPPTRAPRPDSTAARTNATGLEWGARPALTGRLISTECRGGLLWHSAPDADFLTAGGSWADRRKIEPYNLFYGDIERDVSTRGRRLAAAKRRVRQQAPAGFCGAARAQRVGLDASGRIRMDVTTIFAGVVLLLAIVLLIRRDQDCAARP